MFPQAYVFDGCIIALEVGGIQGFVSWKILVLNFIQAICRSGKFDVVFDKWTFRIHLVRNYTKALNHRRRGGESNHMDQNQSSYANKQIAKPRASDLSCGEGSRDQCSDRQDSQGRQAHINIGIPSTKSCAAGSIQ